MARRPCMTNEPNELKAQLEAARSELAAMRRACGLAPPGHFYSPLINLDEVHRDRERLFAEPPRTLPGVEMREAEQLALLHELAPLYASIPFQKERGAGQRYQYENQTYSYSDAIMLHSLMRLARPRRVIEVGSGWSSCAMLDTNEQFLGNQALITCIEPFPELLLHLISEADRAKLRLLPQRVQDVPLAEFEALAAGDMLFVDSTHVSKLGSDVNHLVFSVLPRLASGVLVHFHDIFWPFEYPRHWIEEGRSWNEAYVLRAFLQHNPAWQVVLMNTYVEHFHRAWFEQHMPLCLENPGGSLWLRKV